MTMALKDLVYPLIGIRLKAANIDASTKLVNVAITNNNTGDYEWLILFNPTLSAATETWSNESDSVIQKGIPTVETATGGTYVTGGYVKGGKEAGSDTFNLNTKQILGSAIDGTQDEIWLCIVPGSNGDDFRGGITWNEFS